MCSFTITPPKNPPRAEKCFDCPRMCGAVRSSAAGFCRESDKMRVAKIMVHRWEEPCISGANGSGAVFFLGCNLRCVYCQNKKISRGGNGTVYEPESLAREILKLQESGVHNINLVTPTHFASQILKTAEHLQGRLRIPVVWNTSGYEREETVAKISPFCKIFLTDFKYFSPEMSSRYSSCPDYFENAIKALCKMVSVTGAPKFDKNGIMTSGVVVRHLVLPRGYRDSIKILEEISSKIGTENIVLSLMSQYTPEFLDEGFPELNRRVTTFEYNKVVRAAMELGFGGYVQDMSSADSSYTPDF